MVDSFDAAEFGDTVVTPIRLGAETWETMRRASERTGVPIATVRRWRQQSRVRSRHTGDGNVEVLSSDIDKRAGAYRAPQRQRRSLTQGPMPTSPPDAVILPLDSWQRLLNQLGNIHEAGQELAGARERAARAETEALFLRERLAELRSELERMRRIPGPPTSTVPTAESTPITLPGPQPRYRRLLALVRRWWS